MLQGEQSLVRRVRLCSMWLQLRAGWHSLTWVVLCGALGLTVVWVPLLLDGLSRWWVQHLAGSASSQQQAGLSLLRLLDLWLVSWAHTQKNRSCQDFLSLGLELAQCPFRHIILVKTGHGASPESRGGGTQEHENPVVHCGPLKWQFTTATSWVSLFFSLVLLCLSFIAHGSLL